VTPPGKRVVNETRPRSLTYPLRVSPSEAPPIEVAVIARFGSLAPIATGSPAQVTITTNAARLLMATTPARI